MEKITSQRKIISDYLKNTFSHPKAEDVYLEVRRKLPQISLGTVYRILNLLKNKGEVREILYEVNHYDANLSPHSHFICEGCKKIFDIETPNLKKINKKTNGKSQKYLKQILGDFSKVGKINHYQIYFYGKCKNCVKKSENK